MSRKRIHPNIHRRTPPRVDKPRLIAGSTKQRQLDHEEHYIYPQQCLLDVRYLVLHRLGRAIQKESVSSPLASLHVVNVFDDHIEGEDPDRQEEEDVSSGMDPPARSLAGVEEEDNHELE